MVLESTRKIRSDYSDILVLISQTGCTPLIWTSQKDNFEISYYLIEHGANIDSRDNVF